MEINEHSDDVSRMSSREYIRFIRSNTGLNNREKNRLISNEKRLQKPLIIMRLLTYVGFACIGAGLTESLAYTQQLIGGILIAAGIAMFITAFLVSLKP